jgi:hypothetical protein
VRAAPRRAARTAPRRSHRAAPRIAARHTRPDVRPRARRLAVAQGLIDSLVRAGVTILTHTSTTGFEVPDDAEAPITVALKGADGAAPPPPASLECDIFLAAMGRRPTTDGLGLAEAGAALDEKSGALRVDRATFRAEGCETVFGAGDVIGAPALASTGVEQAKAAVAHMFGEPDDHALLTHFPVGVWTIPEIGYFGLTLAGAKAKGIDAEEGVAPYTDCLRGRVFSPEGFLKLVFDKADGKILGVHVFGADACELIHFGMELVHSQRTIFDVLSMLFTAVTFHELFKFAAFNGNSKLQFGVQWMSILRDLGAVVDKADLDGLKAKFDELDKDKSGSLDAEELGAMLADFGKPVSKATLSNMLRLADEDGDETISFDEFAKVIGHLKPANKAQ